MNPETLQDRINTLKHIKELVEAQMDRGEMSKDSGRKLLQRVNRELEMHLKEEILNLKRERLSMRRKEKAKKLEKNVTK